MRDDNASSASLGALIAPKASGMLMINATPPRRIIAAVARAPRIDRRHGVRSRSAWRWQSQMMWMSRRVISRAARAKGGPVCLRLVQVPDLRAVSKTAASAIGTLRSHDPLARCTPHRRRQTCHGRLLVARLTRLQEDGCGDV